MSLAGLKVKSHVKAAGGPIPGQFYWCTYTIAPAEEATLFTPYKPQRCVMSCYNENDTVRWIPAFMWTVTDDHCSSSNRLFNTYFKISWAG